jgi:hypothetical protein
VTLTLIISVAPWAGGRPCAAAGLLLPAVARRLDAVHQIWLAAAVADYPNRRSLLTELRADPQTIVNPEWLGIDPTADPVLATYFLFHDADPARISSSYLLPRGDRALRVAWMARVARERLGVEPIDVDGGHNLYVARPELVAEVIATQI